MNIYHFIDNNFYPITGILTAAAFVIMDVVMLKRGHRLKVKAINEIFKNKL